MPSPDPSPLPEPNIPADHSGPRTLLIQGDVRMLERDIKESKFRDWTIACDERVAIGGDGTAPEPLSYFASSIIF